MRLFEGRIRAIVVAPHPDDDVLGCGGTVALAAERGLAIRVLYVTDGAASHTGSAGYPPQRLRDVREIEARAGLAALGVAGECARFLRWPDGTVPHPADPKSLPLTEAIAEELGQSGTLVLFPWRRDPHPDHRAVAALVADAAARMPEIRLAEYAVWLDERGSDADAVASGEGETVTIDIAGVLERKRRAIEAHRSQLGLVIHDAQTSFTLPPSLIARALSGTERLVVTERSEGKGSK